MAKQKKRKAKESKSKLKINLTPTTMQNLKKIAKKVKLSKTQLVEDIVKGKIAIASQCATKTITFEESLKDNNSTKVSQNKIKILNDNIKAKKTKDNRDRQKEDQPLASQFKEQANLIEGPTNKINEQQAENNLILQQKLAEQEKINKELTRQLNEQKEQAMKYKKIAEDNVKTNQSLQQELTEKTDFIEQLKQKSISLQSLARLGESQLTKWQNRFFINN